MENSLQEKQFEVLLDIHTKKLRNEMQELREELSRVKSDIIRELKEVRGVRQDTPHPVEKQVEAPAQKEKRITEPIDRNGVSPDEVSIEKIFYVGTR